MFNIKNYFIFIIAAIFIYPLTAWTQNVTNPTKTQTAISQKVQKPVKSEVKQLKPEPITPEEVKLGNITYEKPGEGIFTLKNTGTGVIDWSTEGPSGWRKTEQQKLSGLLKDKSESLKVEIRLLHKESSSDERKQKKAFGYAEMKLESGDGKLICTKELSAGVHKEAIRISYGNEQKTIFVTFIIAYTQKPPLINLSPMRLDMGCVQADKTVFKKIILANSGKEKLTWSVANRKHEKEAVPEAFQHGRYISFANEEIKEAGVYAACTYLKDIVEFTGKWTVSNGYPSCADGENVIKINFSGTGIILYLSSFQKGGDLALSLDKQLLDNKDLFEDLETNEGELLITDKLANGPHVLTITSRNNYLVFEGIKILGGNTALFPENSIKIVPNSGANTRQSNYLTVTLNTRQMQPGSYVDDIVFTTNGGEAIVEVFAEVIPDNIVKAIDIYRYFNGEDYYFTADPQPEVKRLIQNKYVKEGIAFRLFKPDTPGTTVFYRWYNPQSRSHFYHYSNNGGGKDLRGYVYEGSIGNIATSRLTNTRELYRWYNSKTGRYFYSTDAQGGKINKNAYRFDGIAGYVK
jgi:hypothetical protein